jgi:hypothetical protein
MMGSNDQDDTILSYDHHDVVQEESLLQPATTADVVSQLEVEMNDKNDDHQIAGNYNNNNNQSQVAILTNTTQADDDRDEQQQVMPSKKTIRIHKMNNQNSHNSSISATTRTNSMDPDCVFF